MGKMIVVKPGKLHAKEMPHSEVMMHMKVAGKRMMFKLEYQHGRHMIQLYEGDLVKQNAFSSKVLPGEAGVYWNENSKEFYYYKE